MDPNGDRFEVSASPEADGESQSCELSLVAPEPCELFRGHADHRSSPAIPIPAGGMCWIILIHSPSEVCDTYTHVGIANRLHLVDVEMPNDFVEARVKIIQEINDLYWS